MATYVIKFLFCVIKCALNTDLSKKLANKYLAGVAITSTAWVVPQDGYAILNTASVTSGKMGLDVIDSNGTDHTLINHVITGTYQVYSVFVRKGMKIKLTPTTPNGIAANFCGLKV